MTTTVTSLTDSPVSEKEHLSVSAIESAANCPKAFQLERVLGLPTGYSYARAGGSAVHAAIEMANRLLFAESGR